MPLKKAGKKKIHATSWMYFGAKNKIQYKHLYNIYLLYFFQW